MDKPTDNETPSNVVSITSPKGRRGQGLDDNGLTAKQEQFAQAVAKGTTLADSYRAAYATENMKPSTIWSRASELASSGKVTARVAALVAQHEAETVHDGAALRRFVREQLHSLALSAETDAVKVRSLELLGKLTDVASFADHVITEDLTRMSSAELTEQLEKRLKSLKL